MSDLFRIGSTSAGEGLGGADLRVIQIAETVEDEKAKAKL